MITFYHNPRCRKSREALALLQAQNQPLQVVEYLKTPPQPRVIQDLLTCLGLDARALMRRQEAIYQTLGLDNANLSEADLIAAMHQHPILIERPIAVFHEKAVIGRPPERVLELL